MIDTDDAAVAQSFGEALALFPGLQKLTLESSLFQTPSPWQGPLLSDQLDKLAGLRELNIKYSGRLSIAVEGVLPYLTRLHIKGGEGLGVNASLPSLCSLSIKWCNSVQLRHEQLQLSALTSLELCGCGRDGGSVDVNFACMPALACLEVQNLLGRRSVTGLSGLAHLTSLTLFCGGRYTTSYPKPASGLLAFPPSLRRLDVSVEYEPGREEFLAALPFGSTPQLTSFSFHSWVLRNESAMSSTGIIPHLAPLHGLLELVLWDASPAHLTVEHMDRLVAMPSLTRLAFGDTMPEGEQWILRMEVRVFSFRCKRQGMNSCVDRRGANVASLWGLCSCVQTTLKGLQLPP